MVFACEILSFHSPLDGDDPVAGGTGMKIGAEHEEPGGTEGVGQEQQLKVVLVPVPLSKPLLTPWAVGVHVHPCVTLQGFEHPVSQGKL